MRIGVIGINHKSAEIESREKLAKACQRRLGGRFFFPELSYVQLSTCNRTEIYFSSPDLAVTHSYLLAIFREEIKEEFEHQIYAYFGSDCFLHLAKVTAGLDSAVLGETEIQGQVKGCYAEGAKNRYLNSEIHYLFQKSLSLGKKLRSSVHLSSMSLEQVVWQEASAHLGSLCTKRVLFVGVSEINRRIWKYIRQKSAPEITFCNRTYEKMASLHGVYRLPWEELSSWQSYDLIVFATKAPEYLISTGVKPALPQLLIDLSVPRNVDPVLIRLELGNSLPLRYNDLL